MFEFSLFCFVGFVYKDDVLNYQNFTFTHFTAQNNVMSFDH